ncbi:hypothetical protein [Mycobacterium branderi]|uniref:Transposase n=1 Tax=Mycobacterium branderi TaxID=43348 RepID=A0A7I7W5E0_9MYCO|nr:hypothetical protein [Mycobacterium branderi]MCV7235995.1 hypothetical protein [Mycobacterium branderi]ORA31247.1 hypothetical protein BST20_27275 [Mycobacterium branderi]BBZ12055.1 hypothetical protein MBRA_22500 [Mycobacterium branderi]
MIAFIENLPRSVRGRVHLPWPAGSNHNLTGFLTSRGYRAAKTRSPSDRAMRDELLIQELKTVYEHNHSVYGVKKMQGR